MSEAGGIKHDSKQLQDQSFQEAGVVEKEDSGGLQKAHRETSQPLVKEIVQTASKGNSNCQLRKVELPRICHLPCHNALES